MESKQQTSFISKVLTSIVSYNEFSREKLSLFSEHPNVITNSIIDDIISVFSDIHSNKPIAVLNCLRFVKQLMDTRQNSIVFTIEKKILPFLIQFAMFEKDKQEDDRGKFYFIRENQGKSDEEREYKVIGNSFLRLCLECLLAWKLFFPGSEFETQTDLLLLKGVKFPNEINYFKKWKKYLLNPHIPLKSSAEYESNESPDNLFASYTKDEELVSKLQESLNEYKKIVGEIKNICNNKDIDIKNLGKIIEKFATFEKKSQKLMETVMYSSLKENDERFFMKEFYEASNYCSEIIEDYRKMTFSQITQFQFLSKYVETKPRNRIFSGMMKMDEIEMVNANVYTREELLSLHKDKRSSISPKLKSKKKINESPLLKPIQNGKYLGQSVVISKSQKELLNEIYPQNSPKLKSISLSSSGSLMYSGIEEGIEENDKIENKEEESDQISHFEYLKRQFLKQKNNKGSLTLTPTLEKRPSNKLEKAFSNTVSEDGTINKINLLNGNTIRSPEIFVKINEDEIIFQNHIKLVIKKILLNNPNQDWNKIYLASYLWALNQKIEICKNSANDLERQNIVFKEKLQNTIIKNEALHNFHNKKHSTKEKLIEKIEKFNKENVLFKILLKQFNETKSKKRFNSVDKTSKKYIFNDEIINENVLNLKNSLIIISQDNPFEKLKEISNYDENIIKYKLCCLQSKSILFKAKSLQIGMISEILFKNERPYIKLSLYFENTESSQNILDLKYYIKSEKRFILNSTLNETLKKTIKFKEQELIEFFIDFPDFKTKIILIEISYRINDQIYKNIIALPNLLNKYIWFKDCKIDELTQNFITYNNKIKKSNIFELNSKLISDSKNILYFLPFLLVNKNKNKNSMNFFSKFEITKYIGFMKLKIVESKKIIVKILISKNEELATHLLEIFEYLLKY